MIYLTQSIVYICPSSPPIVYLTLFSSPEDRHEDGAWCNIAYWEHNQRIGALHCVTDPIVTIANKCSDGKSTLGIQFCLKHLQVALK